MKLLLVLSLVIASVNADCASDCDISYARCLSKFHSRFSRFSTNLCPLEHLFCLRFCPEPIIHFPHFPGPFPLGGGNVRLGDLQDPNTYGSINTAFASPTRNFNHLSIDSDFIDSCTSNCGALYSACVGSCTTIGCITQCGNTFNACMNRCHALARTQAGGTTGQESTSDADTEAEVEACGHGWKKCGGNCVAEWMTCAPLSAVTLLSQTTDSFLHAKSANATASMTVNLDNYPPDSLLHIADIKTLGLTSKWAWCGPDHYPRKPDGSMDHNAPSDNELDEVCKQHDICYDTHCDHYCPCDHELLVRAPKAECATADCEAYRAAMIAVFEAKPGVVCKKIRGMKYFATGVGGVCGIPVRPGCPGCRL